MAAGENTLDTILCRLLVDSMVKVRKGGPATKGIVDVDKLVDRYLRFPSCSIRIRIYDESGKTTSISL